VGQRLVGETTPVPPSYSTVTLAVTPAQAAVLAYASTRGGLTLDLRNVTDQATIQLAPETGVGIPGAG
jgi:Flp pilus assembly protein CpaB